MHSFVMSRYPGGWRLNMFAISTAHRPPPPADEDPLPLLRVPLLKRPFDDLRDRVRVVWVHEAPERLEVREALLEVPARSRVLRGVRELPPIAVLVGRVP